MHKRRNFAVLLLTLFCLFSLGAQVLPGQEEAENQIYGRGLGYQIFEIDLGINIPAFLYPNDAGTIGSLTNLKPGGTGALKWSSFLNDTFALGVDISGFVTTGPNNSPFTMFPIGIRASNFFRINQSIQIPVHLTTALNVMQYKDLRYLGLAVKPGFSLYWDASKDWSFGLNFLWWIIPEIYTDPLGVPPSSQTRIGNIFEVTVSALYNFNS